MFSESHEGKTLCGESITCRPEWVFRVDASEATGMGHLFRCLSLSDIVQEAGYSVRFLMKHSASASIALLEKKGVPYAVFEKTVTFEEEGKLFRAERNPNSVIILDISHGITFSEIVQVENYVKLLRQCCLKVVVIDGYMQNALLNCIPLAADVVITPYYPAESISPHGEKGFVHLAGPEYMIFHPDYETIPSGARSISSTVRKILITCGGSDPKSLTLEALKGLDQIMDYELEIRIVIGPSFNEGLKKKIEETAGGMTHNCTCIESPASLVNCMRWCDLAVSSTGLTKYELALTGTPAVFFSIDREHAEIHEKFQGAGTGVDLGAGEDGLPDRIKNVVERLIPDFAARSEMSRNGMKLVNCRGAHLIVDTIGRLLHAG